MVDRIPLAVVRLAPWNPTIHSYVPSAATPMSMMLRMEVFQPVMRVAGLLMKGLTHSKERALGGSPIVVQLKETLVPRSTTSTSSKEATEGGGGGEERLLYSIMSYGQAISIVA